MGKKISINYLPNYRPEFFFKIFGQMANLDDSVKNDIILNILASKISFGNRREKIDWSKEIEFLK